MPLPKWTVHPTRDFKRQLEKMQPDIFRAAELEAAASWVLSRDPHRGIQLPGSSVWFYGLDDETSSIVANVYYTFNDRSVYLLSITAVPSPSDDPL